MSRRTVAGIALAMLFAANANASLDTPYVAVEGPVRVPIGDTFAISIIGDFQSMGLMAGGVQLTYDPTRLQINAFQTDLAIDPSFSCPGAPPCPADPPGTLSIVWGQILTDLIAPNNGPTLMATIIMTTVSCCGDTALGLIDFTTLTGGWLGPGFQPMSAPEFLGTSIRITTPEGVPLPASVWLMMGAVGALAGLRRKQQGLSATGIASDRTPIGRCPAPFPTS